jgi:chromatin modification-related protein VID21
MQWVICLQRDTSCKSPLFRLQLYYNQVRPTSIYELHDQDIQPLVAPPPVMPPDPDIIVPDSMLAQPLQAPPPREPTPEPDFPLPPVQMLNNNSVWAGLNREKNPAKLQRKREKERRQGRQSSEEKEREKDREKDKDKDGFASMEFVRWAASVRANPIYIHLSRKPSPPGKEIPLISRHSVAKSLSTNDWLIAVREIKILRLSTRINDLQAEARWSFRQPRRQKEPANFMPKTHWDYLREEGRWMWTDFREERKLKAVIGYEIGQELKELFANDERPLKKRRIEEPAPPQEDIVTKMEMDESIDLTENAGIQSVPVNADFNAADGINGILLNGMHDLEGGGTPEEHVDILDTSERAEDLFDDYEAHQNRDTQMQDDDDIDELDFLTPLPPRASTRTPRRPPPDVEMQVLEEVAQAQDEEENLQFDIPDVPAIEQQAAEPMIQEEEDTQVIKIEGETPAEQFLEPSHPELRLADADNLAGPALPTLPFDNEERDSDANGSHKGKGKGKEKERSKLEDPAFIALRDPILQLGPEAFSIPPISLPSSAEEGDDIFGLEKAFPSLSMNETLLTLFPDLKPYNALPPPPIQSVPQDHSNAKPSVTRMAVSPVVGKEKKDSQNSRRMDETVTKVAHTSRHMKSKAVLMSTLNPGQNYNYKTGQWDGSGEFVVYANGVIPPTKSEEQGSGKSLAIPLPNEFLLTGASQLFSRGRGQLQVSGPRMVLQPTFRDLQ